MPIDFDGADDVITFGSTDDILTENGALTISVWINPNTLGEGNIGRIVGRENNVSPGVGFRMIATASVRFFVFGSTVLGVTASNDSIVLNTWQHIALTWDGSTTATNVHIYVNGIEVTYAAQTNGVSLANNSTQVLAIGNTNTANAQTFDGQISEVALWDSVLSLYEIRQLAFSRVKRIPLQISLSNLKAYWPLDDFSNGSSASGSNSIRDLSPEQRHGTPANSPLGYSEEVLSYV